MHFLQHIYRSANFKEGAAGAKSFQNPEMIYSMHNHRPLQSIGRAKSYDDSLYFELDDARMHHYRAKCDRVKYSEAKCQDLENNTAKDLTLWKYKDDLITNFNRSLIELEAFEP